MYQSYQKVDFSQFLPVRVHVLAPGKLTLRLCLGHFKRGSQILSGTRHTSGSPELGADRGARERSIAPSPKTGRLRCHSIAWRRITTVGTGLVEGILD